MCPKQKQKQEKTNKPTPKQRQQKSQKTTCVESGGVILGNSRYVLW